MKHFSRIFFILLIYFLIFFQFTVKGFSLVDFELWNGLQLNYPAESAVASPTSRLRAYLNYITAESNISLHFCLQSLYAPTNTGSTPLLAFPNDVSHISIHPDNKIVELYSGYASYKLSYFSAFVGMIDPDHFGPDGKGFYQNIFCGNENNGFLNPGFLRLWANNGIEQYYNKSIPSFFLRFEWNEWRFTAGATFGAALEHLFVRNTFPFELEYKTERIHLSISVGLCDADSSTVHKVSPSYGAIAEWNFIDRWAFFVRYSTVEPDITTYRTPKNITNADPFRVAKEFNPYCQHFSTGIVFSRNTIGMGLGYSILQSFNAPLPEHVLEFFLRLRIFDLFEISPDFQLFINPGGDNTYGYHWQNAPEYEFLFNPEKDGSPRYVWIAGIRVYYPFSL